MAARKKILIFAYFFPPLGGAGVQRVVKLAKYLPDFGWDPTIVTVRSRAYWMRDPTLAAELGSRVRVLRTASLTGLQLVRSLRPRRPQRGESGGGPRGTTVGGIRALRRLAGWVLLPDAYRGWVPFAARAGRRLLGSERFDAILTTSSPDSAHLIGLALTRRHPLPWVADFRDPWTRRLSFNPPTIWHRRRHEQWERAVLARAALITVTAEETRDDYLRRVPGLDGGKIRVVTNGYDEADFADLEGVIPPGDRFGVLHAGQLNPERPARPFLTGLRRFFDRQPAARGRVKVRFLGPHYERDVQAARELGVQEEVSFEPGLPHREAVRELCRSHLLLLMEQDSERGALILPGKLFEYMRAGRPTLGLLPEGAAWRLLVQLGAGSCTHPSDTEGCARILGERFAAFERGEAAETGVSAEALAPYERRAIAAGMAEMLERLAKPS